MGSRRAKQVLLTLSLTYAAISIVSLIAMHSTDSGIQFRTSGDQNTTQPIQTKKVQDFPDIPPFFKGTYPKEYQLTNGVPKNFIPHFESNTIDHGNWKQIVLTLSPFYWCVPQGLDSTTVKYFWQQHENKRHFGDTIANVTGIVRVITNGVIESSFSGRENDTYYFNIVDEPKFTDKPQYDTAMFISNHEVEFFQHFLDNGLPHISLMMMATGIDPSKVTFVMPSGRTEAIKGTLKRWGFKDIVSPSGRVSAKTLILPEMVPRIHQLFYDTFRNAMKFNNENANKVILVSRTATDGGKADRRIENQLELEKALKERFGNKFLLFKPTQNSYEKSVETFEKAALVIGSHGGAMYNAFWSGRGTTVVELMPVNGQGFYHGQYGPGAIPPFAHLAMYTNSILLCQEFWRFYSVSRDNNVNVPINDFMKWIEDIPVVKELSKNKQ